VAFSGDGRFLVSTGGDGWTRTWNPNSGKVLRRSRNVAPGLLSDRALVLAAATSRTGRLFRTLRYAKAGADFNQDRTLLVTTSNARIARVFDVRTGRIIARLHHRGRIVVARFAPTADIVATAGADRVARLWDARTGRLRAELKGHTRGLLWVAFSRDGTLVATTSTDATARVWRVADGTLAAVLPGHTNFVRRAEFSPDGVLIVTGGRDRVARVFDADAATLRANLAGHTEPLTDVAFSPDGKAVATASTDGTVRIWDARPFPSLQLVRSLGTSVSDVAFTPAGKIVSTQKGEVLSKDGGRAVTVKGGRIQITDVASDRIVATIDDAAATSALAFSADGTRLATGDRDGIVRFWRIDEGRAELASTQTLRGRQPVSVVAVSPDGSRLLASGPGRAVISDGGSGPVAATLETLRASFTRPSGGSGGALLSAAFSPDGRFVVTTDTNHDARLWDAATGTQIWMLPHTAIVSDASFSADGRWVAIAGPGYAGIVDAKTGERILLLDGRDRILTSVAFSPTGHRIATGGKSGAIRTYNCDVCGGVDELVTLAEGRLAQLRKTP
jgi:WD40 repeat protein